MIVVKNILQYTKKSSSTDKLMCSYLACYTGSEPNATTCMTGGNGFKGNYKK